MSMTESQRSILTSAPFSEDLDVSRQVLIFLRQEGILTHYHVEAVQAKPTNVEKRLELLKFVKQRGSAAFDKLYQALVQGGQDHLAQLMISQVQNAAKSDENRPPSPCEEPPTYENITPATEDALKLSDLFYGDRYKAFLEDFNAKVSLFDPETTEIVECVDTPESIDLTRIYPNFTNPKGLAIIFNNRHFQHRYEFPERLGTDRDARAMYELLTKIGYKVKVKQDHKAHEILDAMKRFAEKEEHNYCHSAVVVVLSHGKDNGRICGTDARRNSDQGYVKVDDFVAKLNAQNCAALIGKPKLFFLQACRGDIHDIGRRMQADGIGSSKIRQETPQDVAQQDYKDAKTMMSKIPTDSDMFIAYATTPGYVSWRSKRDGSWFVQELCGIIASEAHKEHIGDILTLVNDAIGNRITFAESSQGEVQMSSHTSQLRRKFYFFPGITRP